MKTLLVTAAFVAMAVADVASGTERGDGHMAAGFGMIGSAEPADDTDATDREGVPEEISDRGAGGAGAPADAQGAAEPESEYAADGDNAAIAAGPHTRWKGRTGDDGVPAAQRDSAQARAPPLLPAPRTDTGA